MPRVRKKLVVAAIDFGTTYSGYAYSMISDPQKIYTNTWRTRVGSLADTKAPTVLLYDPEAQAEERILFGFEAEDKYNTLAADRNKHLRDVYYFSLFKKHLGEVKISTGMMVEDESGKPMRLVEVISMSIGYMTEHLMKALRTAGDNVVPGEIQWVLTVPAIWSDAAKTLMRQAAEKAGIAGDDLLMALEPEVASVYCEQRPESQVKIPVGTQYMVIDLGGGTADFTVHEKMGDGELNALHTPSGGMWGGASVNEKYYHLWNSLIGAKAMKRFSKEHKEDHLNMYRDIENTKKTVTSDPSSKYTLSIPYNLNEISKEKNVNDESIQKICSSANSSYSDKITVMPDKLRITASLFQSLFMPSIRNITRHIDHLLETKSLKKVSLVLLVGGYSQSPFVQDHIRETLKKYKVDLRVDREANLAVLRGAVLYGHNPRTIGSRIVKLTYGLEVTLEFDPSTHPRRKKISENGNDYCKDVFSTLVVSGTKVKTGHVVKKLHTTLSPHQKHMDFDFYTSMDKFPGYTTDDGCKRMGHLRVGIPHPKKELQDVELICEFCETEVKLRGMALDDGIPCTSSFRLPE